MHWILILNLLYSEQQHLEASTYTTQQECLEAKKIQDKKISLYEDFLIVLDSKCIEFPKKGKLIVSVEPE